MKNTENKITETRIFLASSIRREFKDQRMELSDFVRKLNDVLIGKDRYLRLLICEDIDNAITLDGKQEEYNEEIRSCNHFYTLIGQSIGKWTKEEIGVASEKREPIVHAFIQNTGNAASMAAELESLGFHADQEHGEADHPYHTFNHIDEVKLEMLKTFFPYPSRLQFIDNKIYLDRVHLLDLDKVPISSEEARHYLNSSKEKNRHENKTDLKMITVILASSQDTDSFSLSDHIRDLNDQYLQKGVLLFIVDGW